MANAPETSARSAIEGALERSLAEIDASGPPTLAAALRHALFPGGGRVRPTLCLAVARACGAPRESGLDLRAAAAIEMLHAASLVHDDLPCFDDADLRRGRPSVHRAFGEPLAVLVGDALIVLAFESVAVQSAALRGRAALDDAVAASRIVALLARSVGAAEGLVAGQAWETEKTCGVPLDRYQRAKTGSLFVAATMAGALAARVDPAPWRAVGERLGEAYQVADDLLDAHGDSREAGKPVDQDARNERPSAVRSYGTSGALHRLRTLASEAADAVPECPGAPALRALVIEVAERLVPCVLRQSAA